VDDSVPDSCRQGELSIGQELSDSGNCVLLTGKGDSFRKWLGPHPTTGVKRGVGLPDCLRLSGHQLFSLGRTDTVQAKFQRG